MKKKFQFELNKLQTIDTMRRTYYGTCIRDSVRFVLVIKEQSSNRTIIINDKGEMSDVCFPNGMWLNGVGTGSSDKIKAKIDEGFKNLSIDYELIDIKNEIDENYIF